MTNQIFKQETSPPQFFRTGQQSQRNSTPDNDCSLNIALKFLDKQLFYPFIHEF